MKPTVQRLFEQSLAVVTAAVVLAGCTNDQPLAPDQVAERSAQFAHHQSAQSIDAPTIVASFDPLHGQLPESIAVDRFGSIYLSMSPLRQVWKLDRAGEFQEVVATFPLEPGLFGISGLRFDSRGDLYVAISSTLPTMNGIWKIGAGGDKERIAGTGSIALPNDLATTPAGTFYFTDSAAGAVWRYTPGGMAELWVQDATLAGTGAYGLGVPVGANGIVYVPGMKAPFARSSGQKSVGGLVVANAEKGQLVYVPILPDGSAGRPTVIIADQGLFGIDGITIDARGAIYGAVNAGNKVVRISRDGSEIFEVASGAPLDFPTGLTFGSGRDNHTLFVVNFGVIHFLSTPAMPGDARPSVVAIPIGAPGRSGR